jgi:ABC-type multidrug transport system ATPase subunit
MTATTLQQLQTTLVPDRLESLAADLPVESSVPALLVEGVTKRFQVARKKAPVTAIENVTLRLERGGTIGILGANGSGKSTLIRLVSGLLTLDEGRVEVFGHDITREEMTVKRLINRVSVDAAFFKKLSPALLLLDEPTTGLDPRSKLEVQAFIEEIRASHDASIVLTTHDLDEAERLCGRIAVLNDGRVVAEDSPDGLKQLVASRGEAPTLHAVFMTYTGRSLDDDNEADDEQE